MVSKLIVNRCTTNSKYLYDFRYPIVAAQVTKRQFTQMIKSEFKKPVSIQSIFSNNHSQRLS